MNYRERLESDKNRTREAKALLDEAFENYIRCLKCEATSRALAMMVQQAEMPYAADMTHGR